MSTPARRNVKRVNGNQPSSPVSESVPLEPAAEDEMEQSLNRADEGRPYSFIRSYMSEGFGDLHSQPTAWVVGASTAVVMTCTYIIQHHVVTTEDHLGLFLMGSYVIFSSYFLVHYWLDRLSSSFNKISQDKKFYTISNLIKAGVLAAITPFAIVELYGILVHDIWHTQILRNLGCIYCIPDFVSMILVRRMSLTTYAHHICVCVFNYFSVHNNYEEENVCRLIVVYAAFSTFAYCVNMLLGTRFLGIGQDAVKLLSIVALLVYVGCCALNWTWQAFALRSLIGGPNDHWSVYVYMMLIMFVMWDDIVLMKWLWTNVTTKVVTASGKSVIATSTASNTRSASRRE